MNEIKSSYKVKLNPSAFVQFAKKIQAILLVNLAKVAKHLSLTKLTTYYRPMTSLESRVSHGYWSHLERDRCDKIGTRFTRRCVTIRLMNHPLLSLRLELSLGGLS
jgi:hypothetical protein